MSSTTAQVTARPSNLRTELWLAMALIVVPFLILIAMQGYEALSRSPRAVDRQQLVAHSFEVILTLYSLRGALQDAERGQRGFLLTGQEAYLRPYDSAVGKVPRLLARFARLTDHDPEQRAALPSLTRTVNDKMSELRQTLTIYRSTGLQAAKRIVLTNAGLNAMQSVEAQIDVMISRENELLALRLDKVTAADRTVQEFALASTLLAAVLMMMGVTIAIANFRRRRQLQREIMHRAEDSARANRQLEERNRELARAGELERAAREEALRAERAKGRFLATASHDLRQPLQAVSLLNGAMRRRATDPDLAEALTQQAEAVGTIGRLINALLDISKLESGVIKPEPRDFAVATLLITMAKEFHDVAASKGLQIHVETEEIVAHSDPALVEQLLRNLTSNAIKYTRAGGVRLRAAAAPPWVHIQVIDSGVGIPAEQIPLLGEEFYQVGVPSNSTREGYGLGMSIVRRLVKLLQINLEIRSEVGQGSTFALRLPQGTECSVATAPGDAATPVVREGHAAGGMQILLVEDDPDVRNATRLLLKTEGYAVMTAATSEEALQKARECARLDLLVTDFHLGADVTGTQVIARLRAAHDASLKAILITGDTSSAVKELAQDPHLRVLSKPVRAEDFLSLVCELLTT